MTSIFASTIASCGAIAVGIMIPLTLWAGNINVSKQVAVKLSPAETWKLVGDFCPERQWSTDVLKCEIISGANNRVGTVRQLTLRNGSTAREQLIAHDAKAHMFSYSIVESGIPVSEYRATFSVKPGDKGVSIVEWKSSFDPRPGVDTATAQKIVEGIYETGLSSLQSMTNR